MNEQELEQVKQKNKTIENILNKIIKARVNANMSVQNGNELDSKIVEIIQLQNMVIREIYQAEYGQENRGPNDVNILDRENDLTGGLNGLKIGKNMNPSLQKIYKQIINGKIEKSGVENLEKYDGSQKDQIDLFIQLSEENAIDLRWIMGVLAHEDKHTYGIVGGNNFIKEGTTEQTTREDCDKYGVFMYPNSHTQEANFIRKLELIIPRDEIIRAGLYNGHREYKEKAITELLNKKQDEDLDEQKIGEIFNVIKDLKEKENNSNATKEDIDKLKEKITKFERKYSGIAEKVEEIVNTYIEKDKYERYDKIQEMYDKKIEGGDFKNLLDCLETIYSIQEWHGRKDKKNPYFYRSLYSKSWQELKESREISQAEYDTLLEMGVDDYDSLISPMKKYIQQQYTDKGIDIEEYRQNMLMRTVPDLKGIMKIQDFVIQELNQRLNEQSRISEQIIEEKVRFFHDQKSTGFFEDMQTGRYNITEQQIGKTTINTSTEIKDEAKGKIIRDEQELKQEDLKK